MGRRSRRKLGSRHYKNYTPEMLALAVDLVRKKNISSLEAEKRFHIPRRTIENKVKGLHMKLPGGQLRLSETEEKDIVDVLIAAADFGSPLSRLDLRILIFEYLNKNRRAVLFSDKIPGKWWVRNFLHRNHEALTERTVQNIKRARAEKTAEEFENYFINLERTVKGIPKENIINYDETNLSDNPGSTKCIFRRKVKYPERILNHSKGNISIMFAASADGSLLPVYTVYKSENLWGPWCIGGPPDARYNRTKSGWFDSVVFEDWFRKVIIPWAKKHDGQKLVIGDNLSSHLNVDIIRLCEQHNIQFAFLPPNSTHLTQPLDVAFFGPLKKVWRKIITQYKIENPSQPQINKNHFPILLKELLDGIQISNKENIKAGFRATGIEPFNPQKVLKKLPDYEEEIKYKIDTALLDYLKKTKAPNPIKRTVPNKKLKVEPGSSISSKDAEELLTKPKKSTKKSTEPKTDQPKTVTIKSTEPKTDQPKTLTIKSNKQKTDQPKTSGKRVTILSDIRISPLNQAYLDIKQCKSLDLKKIDIKSNLTLKKKDAENINPWDNPEPSTSGTQKVTKRKLRNKKQMPTKKQKLEYDSDVESDDDYSLRDTSDEESIMSEHEDMALQNILKNNSMYDADYYFNETMPDIENVGLYVDLETEENKGIDLHERQNKPEKKRLTESRKTDYDIDNTMNKVAKQITYSKKSDNERMISNIDNIETKDKTDNNTKEITQEKKTHDTEKINREVVKEDLNSAHEESKKINCDSEHNKCTINIGKQKIRDTDVLDESEVKLMEKSDNQSMISNIDNIETKDKTDNNTKKITQEKETHVTEKINREVVKEDLNSEHEESRKTNCDSEHNKCTINIGTQQIRDTDVLDESEVILMEKYDNQSMISNIDNIETKDKTDNNTNNSNKCTQEKETHDTEKFNKEVVKEDLNLEHKESRNINCDDENNESVISEESGKKLHRIYENDSVLIRYYNRNNWKYYVGFIEKVDIQEEDTYYSILFLKTVKKPNLKFITCKRDRDVVPSSCVVKKVKLHSVKENHEYVIDDCDMHYF